MSAGFASTVISAPAAIVKAVRMSAMSPSRSPQAERREFPRRCRTYQRGGPPPVERHFQSEGRPKGGDQGTVGDGVETAVGAFPEAEGDVDVEPREFIRFRGLFRRTFPRCRRRFFRNSPC